MTKWSKIDSDIGQSMRSAVGNEAMHRRFLEGNHLTEWARYSHGGEDLVYILRHGRFPGGYHRRPADGYPFPPYVDHARLYRGGPAMLAYHPYQRADDIRREVETWARENGLSARVCGSERSWYYPGGTCLVVVTEPGIAVTV